MIFSEMQFWSSYLLCNGVNSPSRYKSLDWRWWNNGNTKTKTENILKNIFTECDAEKRTASKVF